MEVFTLALPYRSTVQFRSSTGAGGTYALLRLTTRDGAAGVAEVTSIPNIVDSDGAVLRTQFASVFQPLLEGADPFDPEPIASALAKTRGAQIAKAMIDTALWDLRGKLSGEPVWRMLGGSAPEPVLVTGIVFGDSAKAMLADAERTVARGIRSLKVKLWKHSLDDIMLIRDMRKLVGSGVLIYADANYAYGETEARALLPQLAKYDVAMIEDPCNISIERQAQLQRDLPMPILAEIPIDTLADARRYIDAGAAGGLSVHVRRTGITETREMAALAAGAGIPAILGTDLEAGIGSLARVHMRAALPALAAWPAEIQFFERLADDVLAEPLEIVDGKIAVPDRPGFGATIDEQKLRRYATGA